MDPTSSLSQDFSHLSVGDLNPVSTDKLIRVSRERDHFTDDDHKPLDAKLIKFFYSARKHHEEPDLAALLWIITSGDKRLVPLTEEEAQELLTHEPSIRTVLQHAWKDDSFKEVRKLEILWPKVQDYRTAPQVPLPDDPSVVEQGLATQYSWTRQYVGDASEELWRHISTDFRSRDPIYANYLAIVQSSGMGKSRTVDEMSRKHFVIPMNLRDAKSAGYPPPDHDIRNFLCAENSDPFVVYQRACAFLTALFDETASVLRGDSDSVAKPEELPPINLDVDIASISDQFRAYMTVGTSMTLHGRFRTEFFKKVIRRVEKVTLPLCEAFLNRPSSTNVAIVSASLSPSRSDSREFPPIIAFSKIEEVVRNKAPESPTSEPQPRRNLRSTQKSVTTTITDDEPLVTLEFDEAHTMTQRRSKPPSEWSNFGELRRALRSMKNSSLFSLFLSTTGKITQFVSSSDKDLSGRIVAGLFILNQPYTDLGFDQLARKITLDGTFMIDHITSDDHIAHFGRPMFGARFDYASSQIKACIVQFAAMKLLGGEPYTGQPLHNHQKLACLAQRLPIEFQSTTYIQQSQEMAQVEGHLRVCLKIDAGFESMKTVSPSESLLSEAAYWIMRDQEFDPVGALKTILGGFAVDKGDRGELLVMMLLTQARDSAVGPPDRFGKPIRRWTPVTTFFKFLFHPPPKVHSNNHNHANIFIAKGYQVGSNGSSSHGKAFKYQFADSKFYFNHWVKVHQWGVLDVKYLLSLYCRGAAVLCANSQPGIDGLMPFLSRGSWLARDNIGVCLWQTKNDATFTDRVDEGLFERMDPFTLKIFKDSAMSDIPIIRIVFALAANTPSLQTCRIQRIANTTGQSYITYDIWCSGLSSEILCPVAVGKEVVWEALLQRSYGWKDIYDGERVQKGLRRSMNPGVALDKDHWSQWNDSEFLS